MTLVTTFEQDIKNFIQGSETDAEKFYNAFAKLWKKAPSVLETIQNFISELAPVVVAAVGIAAPEFDPAVAGALSVVQIALAGILASLTSVSTGTSLLQNLQNFAATIPQLLSGLQIKDAGLTALITRIVSLITSEAKVILPALQAWITALAASKAPATLQPA